MGVGLRGSARLAVLGMAVAWAAGCGGGDDGSSEQSTTGTGSEEDAATSPLELGSKPRAAPNGYFTAVTEGDEAGLAVGGGVIQTRAGTAPG